MAGYSRNDLVRKANEVVSIYAVCDKAGVDYSSYLGSRAKLFCPFGAITHMDGGATRAFRIYEETNTAYCVDYETEILTQRGWLTGEQLELTDKVLTFNSGTTSWEPLLGIHKFPSAPRRMLSMETKTHSSLSTANHRWVTYNKARKGFIQSETTSELGFRRNDTVPYGGPCVNLPVIPKYSDSFVELVAWFITEGHIALSGGVPSLVSIYQSHKVNPEYCQRIHDALVDVYGPPVPELRYKGAKWRTDKWSSDKTTFSLSVQASAKLLEVAPSRIATAEFVSSLTEAQLILFVETAIDGDGARVGNWKQLCQKDSRILDPVQMAATLLGKPTRTWWRLGSKRTPTKDYALQFLGSRGFRPSYWGRKGTTQWLDLNIPVWCPETPSGTWIARRKGTVYVTGNCFACSQAYDPVGLYVAITDLSRADAAEELLAETGWKEETFEEKWARLAEKDEAAFDNSYLPEALANYCSRLEPDWVIKQLEEPYSSALSKCNAIARLVSSQEQAMAWLDSSKAYMKGIIDAQV